MGQVVNAEYVCTAIDRVKGTSYASRLGGERYKTANVEFLLKMVDKANGGATHYGRGPADFGNLSPYEGVVDVVFGNGRFVILCRNYRESSNLATGAYVASSSDGVSWTKKSLESGLGANIVFEGDKFIVTLGNSLWYSSDGLIWDKVTLPATPYSSYAVRCVYGGGVYVVTCSSNYAYVVIHYMFYSYDFINWVAIPSLPMIPTSMVYGGNKFLVTGKSGKVAISYEGIYWSTYDSSFTGDFGKVAADGGSRFVGIGSYSGQDWNRSTLSSVDGITWQERVHSRVDFSGILYDRGLFIIYGRPSLDTPVNQYGILVSNNGIDWSSFALDVGLNFGKGYGFGGFTQGVPHGRKFVFVGTSNFDPVFTVVTYDLVNLEFNTIMVIEGPYYPDHYYNVPSWSPKVASGNGVVVVAGGRTGNTGASNFARINYFPFEGINLKQVVDTAAVAHAVNNLVIR
jgi:hypothetical protein